MFHSSAIPIALPVSVIIGLIFYGIFHSLDPNVADSIYAAKLCTAIVNLLIGIPKNAIAGDILSLIIVRPISLIAALSIIRYMTGA